MQVSTLLAEAATDGAFAARQGDSFLDNPYRCCLELSQCWQLAYIQAQTDKAIGLRWSRDIPPAAEEHQRKPKPGELENMQPLYQKHKL